MFNELFREQTDAALAGAAKFRKREPDPPPSTLQGMAGALWRGPAAAALETGRALTYAASITPSGAIFKGITTGKAPTSLDAWFGETDYGKGLGAAAKALEPDPQTTGTAAQLTFGLSKFGAKAVGYALTLGPAAPIGFGLDEGASETLRLVDQGVDVGTALAAGGVHGVVSGAAMALPAAGQTVRQTAGLAIGGGPVAFVGEQAAIRTILESQDYDQVAKQYDPFDITGLIASTVAPGVFGAFTHGVRARAKAKAQAAKMDESAGAKPADVPAKAEPPPQEAVDAARVRVLAEHESMRAPEPANPKAAVEYRARIAEAEQAMQEGRAPVRLTDPPRQTEPRTIDLPDGRTVPTRDTEGRPVAATPEEAAELYRWLGESVMRDEQGAPRVLYRTDDADGAPLIRESAETTPLADDVGAGRAIEATDEGTPAPAPKTAQRAATQADEPAQRMASPVFVRAEKVAGTPQAPLPAEQGTPAAMRAAGVDAAWVESPEGPALRVARSDQVRAAPRGDDVDAVDRQATATPMTADPDARPGQARPDPAAPRPVADADEAAYQAATDANARVALADMPDLQIELDDGTRISAAEALAEADEALARAKTDARAFDAAVQCLLRT